MRSTRLGAGRRYVDLTIRPPTEQAADTVRPGHEIRRAHQRTTGKPTRKGSRMRAVPVVLTAIRLTLGAIFVVYGLVKLLGGQFIHDDWVIDSRTTDGTTLVWSFFGYSKLYGQF